MTQKLDYLPPPTDAPPRRSWTGILAFTTAFLVVPCFLQFVRLADRTTSVAVAWAYFAGLLTVPILGMTLAILSLCGRNRRRGFAVAGLTLNGVLLVFLLVITSIWLGAGC